jgi:hypothetical protein
MKDERRFQKLLCIDNIHFSFKIETPVFDASSPKNRFGKQKNRIVEAINT